jgi:hypothetical protein
MLEFGNAVRCPVVVDSPNQQAQDANNLSRIMRVMLSETRPDTQLVLASESLFGAHVPSDAVVVELPGTGLLKNEAFESVWSEIEPLVHEIALNL